jgi:hypothetical protein
MPKGYKRLQKNYFLSSYTITFAPNFGFRLYRN